MSDGQIGGLYLDVGIDFAALAQQLGLSESIVAASAEKMANSYIKAQEKAQQAKLDLITGGGVSNFMKQAEADGFKAAESMEFLRGEVNRLSAARQADAKIQEDSSRREKEMMDRHLGDLQAAARLESEMLAARNKAAIRPEYGPLFDAKAAAVPRVATENHALKIQKEAAIELQRITQDRETHTLRIQKEAAIELQRLTQNKVTAAAAAEAHILRIQKESAIEQARIRQAAIADAQRSALRPEQGPLYNARAAAAPQAEFQAALKQSLNVQGIKDATTEFQKYARAHDVISQAYDKGLVSQQTFENSLKTLTNQSKVYNDTLNQGVTWQSKFQQVEKDAAGVLAAKAITTQQLNAQMTQLSSTLSFVGTRMTAMFTLPIVAGTVAAVKYASSLEVARASFTRLYGSTAVADTFIERAKELSLKSPFSFQDTVDGIRRVTALGVAVKDALPIIKAAGDLTAAVGGDQGNSQRFIKALGDIQAKGRIAGEEIRQLANAGVNATQYLADYLGTTTADVLQRIHKKTIDADTATAAILAGITKRFGGEMEARMNTVQGLFSQLKKQAEFALQDIGKDLEPLTKTALQGLLSVLSTIKDLVHGFSLLPTSIQGTVAGFVTFLALVGPAVTVLSQLTRGIGLLGGAATGLMNIVGAAGAAGTLAGGLAALTPLAWAGLAVGVGVASVMAVSKLSDVNAKLDETRARFEAFQSGKLATYDWLHKDFKPKVDAAGKTVMEDFGGPKVSVLKAGGGDDGTGGKVDNSIKQAFSELGLKDAKKDLADIEAAFNLIGGSLSDMQRGQAIKKIEEQLFLARKEGVLTQAVFDKLFAANRDRVNSPETEMGFSGPSTFAFPEGMHTDWTTYNKDVADNKTATAAAAEEVKKWNKVVLESNKLLNEKSMLEAGGGSGNMEAFAWQEEEEAVTTINGALNKQIATIERSNLAWTINTTVQETWLQGVRAALKPTEDMDKALAAFGIKNHTAELSRMAANWDGVVKAQHEGLIGIMDVKRAWVAMAEERLATGQKLTAADEKQYQQYKRQIDAVNLMKQSWKSFQSQVSTIVTDFGRGVMDIFLPKTPEKKDNTLGVPTKIIDDFKSAFNKLSEQGFSDPKKALDDIIAKIKGAGSAAAANTVALRVFGASGPEIARLLRDGSLSAAQLAATLNIATDSMEKNSAVTENKLSKISQLWREVERSIGRALIETGAKAIATFVGQHMKTLMHSLGELLAKLPIIGSALGKVFGISAPGGFGGIPGGTPGQIPTPPIGLPPMPGVPAPPPGVPGTPPTAPGGGGSGLGGIAGGINMATGIVTAVSSVISNFQFAHMNTALGRIEESTRKTWIVTGEQGSESIQGLIKGIYLSNITLNDRMIDVRSALFDPVAQDLEHLTDVLKGGGAVTGGGSSTVVGGSTVNTTGDTYNIYIDSSLADVGDTDAAVEMIQSASRLLKAQGVTSRHRYSPGV